MAKCWINDGVERFQITGRRKYCSFLEGTGID